MHAGHAVHDVLCMLWLVGCCSIQARFATPQSALSPQLTLSCQPWLTITPLPPPCPSPPNAALCRARGISADMARQMLVYSFGREVVQALRDDALQGRLEAAVTATLASFVSAAVAAP